MKKHGFVFALRLLAAFATLLCFTSCEQPDSDTGGTTETPAANVRIIAKSNTTQKSADFTLSKTYPSGTVFPVYASNAATAVHPTVTAALSGLTLTLSSSGNDISPTTYYVSAAAPGKKESGRLPLTINPFEKPSPLVIQTFNLNDMGTLYNNETGNIPIATPSEYGYWNGFDAVKVTLFSNGTQNPTNSGVSQFQATFTTEDGATINTPAITRSLCIDLSEAPNTAAANQRIGRTFHDGSKDFSKHSKFSFYIRSMHPINDYYIALCNGGDFSKRSSWATEKDAFIGTQYRYEFRVLDYQGKNGNDASIIKTYSTNRGTPKWMKVVIDLNNFAGAAGSPPFDPTQVTGWVFGIKGGSKHTTVVDTTYNYGEPSGSDVTNGMFRPWRTYLNWFVLE